DIYLARQMVADRIQMVAGAMPAGTEGPMMGAISSRLGEIFEFVVENDQPIASEAELLELRSAADWLIRYRLQGVPGIALVVNMGGFIKQYQVLMDPSALLAHGITIGEVKEAIQRSNRNFSGGVLEKGTSEYIIQGLGRIQAMENIEKIVVANRKGVPIYLKEIAQVREGGAFRRGNATHNGKEAVLSTVEMQFRGNTLKTIAAIKKALEEIKKSLPPGIRVITSYDQSILINKSLGNVVKAIIEGGILVTLILVIFLGSLSSAILVAASIPLSVLISFLLMYFFGVSINVMSLGGLAIGVGKMANSSIIMVENIHLRLHERRENPREVVLKAAQEVGPHIFSATAIIILVFLPLLTLEGIEGRMFSATAFAVAASLAGGLLISLTFQPVLSSLLLRGGTKPRDWFIRQIKKVYLPLLRAALQHKVFTLTLPLLLLAATIALVPLLGTEFLPKMDEGSLLISSVILPGSSLQEADRIGVESEKVLLRFPEVTSTYRRTGRAEASEHAHGINVSEIMVNLLPKEQRKRPLAEMLREMRKELSQIPGVHFIFEQPVENKLTEMLTGLKGQLAIKIFGPDLQVLARKAEEVGDLLSQVRGVADLQIEQLAGVPQVYIKIRQEQVARYGLRADDVSEVIETALNGVEVTDVLEAQKRIPIFLRFSPEYRSDIDAVRRILVDTPSGQRVPLESLADIYIGKGPFTINRENVSRRVVIQCNIQDRDQGSFVAEAQERIQKQVSLPPGYFITFGGQFESQQRAQRQIAILFVAVFLLVLTLLFTSFRSLKRALLVLLNVPFALVGGIIALLIAKENLSVSSLVGFIALFGISVQNGIILIAHVQQLRDQGKDLEEAVLEGSVTRLRPILMTAIVTLLGVLPLAIGQFVGVELQRPMAIVYIGGLLLSCVFNTLVLPILYHIFEGRTYDKKPARDTA
ncbi:MAG: CusA/CzcA family heavy metal efflux RND transporter, partial [candidate division NC10 bacterium]|nr:CusA/CzcA family heavy metal efflux RND transporter [candidate division NC10 bacterium]